MKVVVCGSHGLTDSLLMISWRPEPHAYMGNFAAPIFLHQEARKYSREVELMFNSCMKMVTEYENRQPKMTQKNLFEGV